jgi:N-acetylneuraminate 9-O-acetyltransferase
VPCEGSVVAWRCRILASLAIIFVFWDIKSVFYAVWTPFVWLVGYTDPRKPSDDVLHEWYFRSSLDKYVWIFGMVCAFLHPRAEEMLQKVGLWGVLGGGGAL